MDIKIEGFYSDNNDWYQKSLDIRNEIFTNELGFNKHLEFDGLDDKATHYIVEWDSLAVGCARWIETDSTIRVDRFGIVNKFRNRGLGLLLIKYITSEIKPSGKKMELLTTDENVLFFIQQGFKDSNTFEHYDKKRARILTL